MRRPKLWISIGAVLSAIGMTVGGIIYLNKTHIGSRQHEEIDVLDRGHLSLKQGWSVTKQEGLRGETVIRHGAADDNGLDSSLSIIRTLPGEMPTTQAVLEETQKRMLEDRQEGSASGARLESRRIASRAGVWVCTNRDLIPDRSDLMCHQAGLPVTIFYRGSKIYEREAEEILATYH